MGDWALALTAPNAERRVVGELVNRFLPYHFFKRKLKIAHHGRLIEKLVPAFPNYIFVPYIKWQEIVHDIFGVIGMVRFGDEPAKVKQDVIDELKSNCHGDVISEAPKIQLGFKAGDDVLIVGTNSVINRRGKYHHSIGDDRSICLIDCMGRSVFVNVHVKDLRLWTKATENEVNRKHRRRRRQRQRRSSLYYQRQQDDLRSRTIQP